MSDLSQFTYYNNRSLGGVTDPNSADAQSALRAIQQYDPNANYRPTYGSDGQLIGYTLDVDASKLPGVSGSGSLGGTSGHGSGADFVPSFSTVQQNMQLTNPNAVMNSPNYGKVTDNSNIGTPSSLLDVLGPAAVLGFGALMGGIPALYEGVFGQGQFGAGAFDPSLSIGNAMSPYDPGYGSMSPFNPSDADIGLGGSANAPLGSAESSLYGQGALTDPGQALGGSFDPNLDVTGGYKLPMTPGYDQMSPFNPASPEYGQFAINPDGSPVPQLSTGGGSPFDLSKIPQALNALGKIPGLGGGTGSGTGSGGSGGLLQPYNMQPYKSLVAAIRNFGLLGQPNG